MKGPENHTEEYAFLSHDADNDPGKRWQRVGTRMKNDEDPWPKTQSNYYEQIINSNMKIIAKKGQKNVIFFYSSMVFSSFKYLFLFL